MDATVDGLGDPVSCARRARPWAPARTRVIDAVSRLAASLSWRRTRRCAAGFAPCGWRPVQLAGDYLYGPWMETRRFPAGRQPSAC